MVQGLAAGGGHRFVGCRRMLCNPRGSIGGNRHDAAVPRDRAVQRRNACGRTVYLLDRHGCLDAASNGHWPKIIEPAPVAGFLTPGALLAVMAVAITRALTALSVRHAIDEASGQIQKAAKVLDVAAGATIPSQW
ncbi:hypothetical protein BHAOGJBA_0791 [Methylobacterium hispanicum]|uniref:Pterin-binding domain-containing protein n=1 Tax=Methylobacterium hispanicum TaxID=270350 RepID=A0AAV4ZFU7_9HYPH|nr:hypothetical protein [Methylobacterium hispanicum]GJD87291.1 hypothetical protein BHAOGJBA_0791 [Methylobacterium hispanicum]